jgi:bifunctional non-homologous end joining protein LigD
MGAAFRPSSERTALRGASWRLGLTYLAPWHSVTRCIPFELSPLQPTLVKPFHRSGWVYEEKVDGWRIVAFKAGGNVRLVSRKGVDHTSRFPDLAKAIASLPGTTLILDGEVAVFDERLVSRFDLLAEPDPDIPTTPPTYIAFDVLYARERDLRGRPLSERRDVLERLLESSSSVLPVRRLASDGHAAWKEVLARELQGYLGKDPTSTYLAGGPTRSWLKAKVRQDGRFVVSGIVERSEGWSLLLGSVQNGRLIYRGLVHWGVGRRLADALVANGLVRATSPFSLPVPERRVTWLEPRIKVEVTYAQAPPGGALRAPVFRGFASAS